MIKKFSLGLLTLLLILLSVNTSASSNSAQTHWRGTDSTGTMGI